MHDRFEARVPDFGEQIARSRVIRLGVERALGHELEITADAERAGAAHDAAALLRKFEGAFDERLRLGDLELGDVGERRLCVTSTSRSLRSAARARSPAQAFA